MTIIQVSRLGDTTTGICDEDGEIEGEIVSASPDTYANSIAVARVGDTVRASCGHTGIINSGSNVVYANGQAIARVGDTFEGVYTGTITGGSPNVFNGPKIIPAPKYIISPTVQESVNTFTNNYIANPGNYALDSGNIAGDGEPQIKENYPGTPDDGGEGEAICTSGESYQDIVDFLDICLAEAARGFWRETGQNGNPSNQEIINIWRELGFPQTGAWLSDQTPWCMGFVNYVLKRTKCKWVQTARARDISSPKYETVQVSIGDAQPGDVAYWSYSHVNFIYTKVGNTLTFVGGNQSPRNTSNPNDGDVTHSWQSGYNYPGNGTLVSIWRPKINCS